MDNENGSQVGRPSGSILPKHTTFAAALERAWQKINPDEPYRPSVILETFIHNLLDAEVSPEKRAELCLALMRFMYPTLKSVDHTGTVAQVKVELSPREITDILTADPFLTAKPILPDAPSSP